VSALLIAGSNLPQILELETHQMRTLFCTVIVAACLGASVACAADVEFEFGSILIEQTTVEKPAANETGLENRMVIDDQRSYDSPLYEGLWPMTLEAFRGNHRMVRTDAVPTFPKLPTSEPRLFEPRGIVPPGVLITSNPATHVQNFAGRSYQHPLYDGLWPMTIKAFKRSDWGGDLRSFGLVIAFNR
jgi:hypothetical protein